MHPQDLVNWTFVHATPLHAAVIVLYDRHDCKILKSRLEGVIDTENYQKGYKRSSIAIVTEFCSSDAIVHLNSLCAGHLGINLLLHAAPFVQGTVN